MQALIIKIAALGDTIMALPMVAALRRRHPNVYGDVPTNFRRALELCLPKELYRGVQHLSTYGMSMYCVGERIEHPPYEANSAEGAGGRHGI